MEGILMSDLLEICKSKGSWPDLGTRSTTSGRAEEYHKNIYNGI
jgi:hypothetical protein